MSQIKICINSYPYHANSIYWGSLCTPNFTKNSKDNSVLETLSPNIWKRFTRHMMKSIRFSWLRLFLFWSHDFIRKESSCINKRIHGKSRFTSWKEAINWAFTPSLIMSNQKNNIIICTHCSIWTHTLTTIPCYSENDLQLHSCVKNKSEPSALR